MSKPSSDSQQGGLVFLIHYCHQLFSGNFRCDSHSPCEPSSSDYCTAQQNWSWGAQCRIATCS